MNMRNRAFAVSFVTIALAVSLIASSAEAQTATNSTNGLRVSPVRSDLTINPGETGKVTIFVQNVTSSPATLRAIVNDFIANTNETGQPDLILDENQYAESHSIKRFIVPIPNVTLQPNEQKQVVVSINVPKNASAGGYYGAVRFAPASAAGTSNVTLSASVGSLILVRVPGDIKEQLSVASFDVRQDNSTRLFFTDPKKLVAVARFQNQGNVQVEPFGKITLKDRSGKILNTTEINNVLPRGSVLPDSIRRFDVPLDKVGKFGKYKLEASFGYGTTGQLITASTSFYVIPLPLLIIVGSLLLLLILACIFGPKAVKAYNRRILRKAHYR